MGRTAKKLSVDNFILNRKPYFLLLRLHIYNRMDLFHLLIQIYRYFFQMDLSASDLAHIQNIIDQGQQMMRCFIDLFQTVFDPLRIIQIFLMISTIPMIPLIGVRISWDIWERNSLLD